jgi:hypothetical protein
MRSTIAWAIVLTGVAAIAVPSAQTKIHVGNRDRYLPRALHQGGSGAGRCARQSARDP